MTEEDFARLGVHLEEVVPLVEDFCRKHRFERIVGSSVGRYPRVRLQRCDKITLWLDLWMGLDEGGQRFSHFSPNIPYELSAGAYFDELSECADKWRYQKSFVIWPSKPFSEIAAGLPEALEIGLTVLEKWELDFLKKEGLPVQLG